MNNIQKAGQYFIYLFYTLIAESIFAIIYSYKIDSLLRDNISNSYSRYSNNLNSVTDEIKTYRNIFEIVSSICAILFFIFLFKAARNLQQTETLESSEDEILTSGEIMKRFKMDSEDEILTSGEIMKRFKMGSENDES
jgi:hypothetical protein